MGVVRGIGTGLPGATGQLSWQSKTRAMARASSRVESSSKEICTVCASGYQKLKPAASALVRMASASTSTMRMVSKKSSVASL